MTRFFVRGPGQGPEGGAGRRWRRARGSLAYRSLRALVGGATLVLGGAAVDQHLHLLRLLLTAFRA